MAIRLFEGKVKYIRSSIELDVMLELGFGVLKKTRVRLTDMDVPSEIDEDKAKHCLIIVAAKKNIRVEFAQDTIRNLMVYDGDIMFQDFCLEPHAIIHDGRAYTRIVTVMDYLRKNGWDYKLAQKLSKECKVKRNE